MNNSFKIAPLLRGLCGAAIGGLLGFYVFGWILKQGFYAMVLPGAMLGLGFGLASREYSKFCGVVSGLLALGFGLFMEWHEFPFAIDRSFGYFISHVHHLKPITLIMIALGGLVSFWFGVGRETIARADSNKSGLS